MVLSDSTVQDFRQTIEKDWNTLIADWVKIAETPAPTGEEQRRAQIVAELFREYGAETVEQDGLGNVIARTREETSPTLAITAHLDTVFDHSVDHTVSLDDRVIQGPGVGDDSLGLAALVSLLRTLPRRDLGDCLLVATCGTEGEGNLLGSREFLEAFSDQLDFALCLEGHRLSRIDHRSLGTHRIKIRAKSDGGHVWRDETGVNPIEVLSDLIVELKQVTALKKEEGIVNFGMFRGGSAYNTVPYEAELKVEIRVSRHELLSELTAKLEQTVDSFAMDSSLELGIETVSRRPVAEIPREHWLVRSVESVHDQIGLNSRFGAASSDSSVFLDAGVPAVTLGLAEGENKHRPNETIDLSSVRTGQLQLLLSIIEASKQFRRERDR